MSRVFFHQWLIGINLDCHLDIVEYQKFHANLIFVVRTRGNTKIFRIQRLHDAGTKPKGME